MKRGSPSHDAGRKAEERESSSILVVDDSADNLEIITARLRSVGYDVITAADGESAVEQVRKQPPDLILLDVMLPGMDGYEVARVVKRDEGLPFIPIILVTARDSTEDKITGLDAGADDYLPKPFALDELLARLRALLRRVREDDSSTTLRIADLTMDPRGRRAWRGDREIELTKTEFDLLELLVRNAGVVLDQTTIYERIWGFDFGPDSKNLAVYIRYTRLKTEDAGEPRLIHTVRGVGYVVRES